MVEWRVRVFPAGLTKQTTSESLGRHQSCDQKPVASNGVKRVRMEGSRGTYCTRHLKWKSSIKLAREDRGERDEPLNKWNLWSTRTVGGVSIIRS